MCKATGMSSWSIVLALSIFTSAQAQEEKPLLRSLLVDDTLSAVRTHLSRDGTKIAVAGGSLKGGDWKVYDLTNGKCVANGMDGNLRCWGAWAVRLSHDGSLLAVGGNRNLFFLVETKTGNLIWDLTNEGHIGVIHDLYFSPDDKYLISAGGDMMIRVWDIQAKKAHAAFRFTSTNPRLNDWKSELYVEKAKRAYDIGGKYNFLGRCGFAPNGKTIALAGNLDGEIPLLDLSTGKIVKSFKIKERIATAVKFTPDGKWLLVASCTEKYDKGTIEILDVEKGEHVTSFGRHEGTMVDLAISPDKKTLISGGGGGSAFRVWDVAAGKQKFSYFTKEDTRMPRVKVYWDGSKNVQEEARTAGVAFLPDGKTFLFAPSWIGTEIYFHDTATGEPVDYREAVKRLPANPK